MLSRPKKSSRHEQTICVCVVESYAVSAAAVRIYRYPGSVSSPVVLFSEVQKIPAYHEGTRSVLESLTCDTVRKVLEKCRSAVGNFDSLICTVGEPWSFSFSRTSHLEKREPFNVTEALINDIVTRESRLFEQEIVRDYGEGEEMGIVGTSRPVVDINGYRVSEYVGAMATSVDVHIQFSLAPARFVEELIATFGDVFHRTDVTIASIDTARNLLAIPSGQATVIDMGGISTSISVVDREFVTRHILVPEGLATLEAHLGQEFGIFRNQTDSVMNFAADQRLLENDRDAYYHRIESAYRSLSQSLREGASLMRQHAPVLPPVVVVGSPSWLPVLRALIADDVEAQVAFLPESFFESSVVYPQGSPRTTGLSLAILQAAQNL